METDFRWVIWWTSDPDCREIGEPHYRAEWLKDGEPLPTDTADICWLEDTNWPTYLQEEYADRYGRVGHARLWIPTEIQTETKQKIQVYPWPKGVRLADRLTAAYAGIVCRAEDLPLLWSLPGIVTNAHLQRLPAQGAPVAH